MATSQLDKLSTLSSVTVLGSLLFCPAITTSSENTTISKHIVNVNAVKKNKFDDNTNYSFERKLINSALKMDYTIPNEFSFSLSKRILNHFDQKIIRPEFINPSEEGGVILEFYSADNYLLVEVYNDGDVVLLKRNGNRREAFDLNENTVFAKIDELV